MVIESSGEIIVADAKYYGAQSSGTAPGFADLLKQSFYSKGIAALSSGRSVRSLFVFPAWDDRFPLSKGGFFDRGTHERTDWLDDVECLYIDVPTLMKNYISKKRWDWHVSETIHDDIEAKFA